MGDVEEKKVKKKGKKEDNPFSFFKYEQHQQGPPPIPMPVPVVVAVEKPPITSSTTTTKKKSTTTTIKDKVTIEPPFPLPPQPLPTQKKSDSNKKNSDSDLSSESESDSDPNLTSDDEDKKTTTTTTENRKLPTFPLRPVSNAALFKSSNNNNNNNSTSIFVDPTPFSSLPDPLAAKQSDNKPKKPTKDTAKDPLPNIFDDETTHTIKPPPPVDNHITTIANSNNSNNNNNNSNNNNNNNESLNAEILKLKQQVELLNTKVEELTKQNTDLVKTQAQSKAHALAFSKQLEQQKAKEAAETKILEGILKKVEENLQQTTARAQAAEKQVAELQQELTAARFAASKNVSVGVESATVEQMRSQFLEARSKARIASNLLRKAAEDAENNIRQLVSGVGVLVDVSGMLVSLDRIIPMQDPPT